MSKTEEPKKEDVSKMDTKPDAKPDAKGLEDDSKIDWTKPLKLVSKDKKEFTVERKHAFISTLVKTSLENDDKAEEVPIPGVMGNVLDLVISYMKEHRGVEPPIIEKPLRSKVMKDVCPHKWDAEYIDKIGNERQKLYDLILAANCMCLRAVALATTDDSSPIDYRSRRKIVTASRYGLRSRECVLTFMLTVGCAKVASLIKGQPLEKIKEILDPKNDATVKVAPSEPRDKDIKESKNSADK
jgi:hypothetical protein